LADGIENYSKLGIVLLFKFLKLTGEILVRGKELSEPDKCPHDIDVHLDGAFAIENTGEHCYRYQG